MARANLFPSETPPPAEHVSFDPALVGTRFGSWEVTSPERRYTRGWSAPYVHTVCRKCDRAYWTAFANLTTGKSTMCVHCAHRRQVPKWLEQRFAAAKQRCRNPKDPGWKNYGGRGIEFRFPSVLAAGKYMIETFGAPNRDTEIDRIDNNRHYEPGNLRWATHAMNSLNTRRRRLPNWFQDWDPNQWPYSQLTVKRMLREGATRGEIIASAWQAVKEKRKNWRGILAKLQSMTS